MFHRTAVTVLAAFALYGLAPRAGFAQQPSWVLTPSTDPGTGEAVITAQVDTRSSVDPTHVFRFTLRCSSSTNLRVGAPNAFRIGIEASSESGGQALGRPLPWPDVAAGGARTLTVGYQIDGNGSHPAELGYAAANRGAIRGMVVLKLPADRLVLHGVFPGEPVDVPFATLTADDRARLAAACIPPGLETVFSVGPGINPPKRTKYVGPVYPTSARQAGLQGQVVVEALIGPDGRIAEAKVLRGLSPDLDAEALKAVRSWRYTPTTFEGVPISLNLTVVVTFSR